MMDVDNETNMHPEKEHRRRVLRGEQRAHWTTQRVSAGLDKQKKACCWNIVSFAFERHV